MACPITQGGHKKCVAENEKMNTVYTALKCAYGTKINIDRQVVPCTDNVSTTRMWTNAQRDGHLAEYRWRPLFNAAKFS